jgi:hypothetical protein
MPSEVKAPNAPIVVWEIVNQKMKAPGQVLQNCPVDSPAGSIADISALLLGWVGANVLT